MDFIIDVLGYLLFPIMVVGRPSTQYYWLTYIGAGICAIVFFMFIKRRIVSARSAVAIVFPKKLLSHPSSKLDMKLVFVGIYYVLLQGLMVGGLTMLSVEGASKTLTSILGEPPMPHGPSYLITGLTMLLVFIAVEFGYWLAHYMMHKVPILWEFHKVHHSAEVLTPLTEWRQHPVELALFPMLIGFAVIAVQGPMVWYFGESSQVINPVSANLVSMAFWYTILHLRHSEVPIYATGIWGKIIQAPAHHQAHHSTNPAHFDTNLGYCLSIWDWSFGTLYVPKKGEKFSYGLGHQDSALETVVGSMLAPIGRAGTLILRKIRVAD